MSADLFAQLAARFDAQEARIAALEEQLAALEAQQRDNGSPWMRPGDAATYLGVKPGTIAAWLAQGRLSRHYVGGQRKNAPVLIPRAEVEALVVPEPGRRRPVS